MTVKLSDPLKSNVLPKSFHTLGLTHHSPTQATLPDGVHLFKYGLLTQQERRQLPGNAQMKAGVLCDGQGKPVGPTNKNVCNPYAHPPGSNKCKKVQSNDILNIYK